MMAGYEAGQGHIPVLLEELLRELRIREGAVYLDGTVGEGGHSAAILTRFAGTRIIGLDRDSEILELAGKKLREFGGRVQLRQADFRNAGAELEKAGVGMVDGIILDLGVSSRQLESGRRGFSFQHDGPLDMRMDLSGSLTAEDVVNEYSSADLKKILSRYGEERQSAGITKAIIRSRQKKRIRSTRELAEIIETAMRGGNRFRIHPATRSFQALRIEVNDELRALEDAIPDSVEHLVSGGRMAVVSFHSLEDRIVKRAFRDLENPCRCPSDFPMCVCGEKSKGKVVTRRPIVPGEDEILANPRSRSAKMRIFESKGAQIEDL